jgi:hypothetical protein
MTPAESCIVVPSAPYLIVGFYSLMVYLVHGGVYFVFLRRIDANPRHAFALSVTPTLISYLVFGLHPCGADGAGAPDWLGIVIFIRVLYDLFVWNELFDEGGFQPDPGSGYYNLIFSCPLLGAIFAAGWMLISLSVRPGSL